MIRFLLALVICLAVLGPIAATFGNEEDDKIKAFCKVYQWVCKASCQQSCCHIPVTGPFGGIGGMQSCCTQREADQLGKPTHYCCGGDGPIHDPIFTDFQNRTFEFFGHPGATYNVLTHQDALVNMRLVWAGDRHIREQGGIGTFADVLAFSMPGAVQVLVEVTEQGDMAVSINDEDIDLDQQFEMQFGKTNVSYDPFVEGIGEQIEISSQLFSFVVTAVKAFEDDVSGYNRGHLDLSTEIKSPPGSLEGVLGASLYVTPEDRLRHPDDKKFFDEGQESAYIVKDLFDGMQMRQASAQRRRLIEGAAFNSLIFPLRATLSSRL